MKHLAPLRRTVWWAAAAPGLLASTLAVSPAFAADDAALLRCRALGEAAARLACYDALPLRQPVQAPMPMPGPGPAPMPAAPPASSDFGQERRDAAETLSSQIQGAFEGWGPGSRITLANGQVWQVVDGSEGVYALLNPKVTVRRAVLGGYVLDIEGAKRTPRVRRVQ